MNLVEVFVRVQETGTSLREEADNLTQQQTVRLNRMADSCEILINRLLQRDGKVIYSKSDVSLKIQEGTGVSDSTACSYIREIINRSGLRSRKNSVGYLYLEQDPYVV